MLQNNQCRNVTWQFTAPYARTKLIFLYQGFGEENPGIKSPDRLPLFTNFLSLLYRKLFIGIC